MSLRLSPDEAWEFLKFLLSDEISLWATETNTIPYATDAAVASLAESDDPILSQIPAMLTQDPEHNLMLDPTPEFELLRAFRANVAILEKCLYFFGHIES